MLLNKKCCSDVEGMKVLVDCDALRCWPGGISRVIFELSANLALVRPSWSVEMVPDSVRTGDDRSVVTKGQSCVMRRAWAVVQRIYAYSIWPQIVLPLRAVARGSSVIICPNYVFPIVLARRCLVFVHDTSPFRVAGAVDSGAGPVWRLGVCVYYSILRFYIRYALKVAKGVVVPSERVRELLDQCVGTSTRPIFVVPWGVSEKWAEFVPNVHTGVSRYGDRFVLCVNPHRYESVAKVVTALNLCGLGVVDGSPGLTVKVVGHYDRSGEIPEGAVYCGRVSDEELGVLYREAVATVLASQDSGFGLPVIEALASGCPCIVIAGTAEAEVAKGHGVLEISDDVEALSIALGDMVNDPRKREHLASEGVLWAKNLTWERSAEGLIAVIERLCACSGQVGD